MSDKGMYGSDNEFTALLSYLKLFGNTTDTITYYYPYAFTETQAKQIGSWFKVGKNSFRYIDTKKLLSK
jgi:hypothetical protein